MQTNPPTPKKEKERSKLTLNRLTGRQIKPISKKIRERKREREKKTELK